LSYPFERDIPMSMWWGRRLFHSSIFRRVTHVVCALLVFSYILFDVLDLDGSNFSRLLAPVERTAIVAEVPDAIPLNYSPEKYESWGDTSLLFTDQSGLYARLYWTEFSGASPLGTARSHGYRVGLARNSLPDSSPYL
jgi:hypothetical protein